MADVFALSLAAFADKAIGNANLVKRRAALDVGQSVVMKTPVGNPDLWKNPAPPGYVGGRLRANWFAGAGKPVIRTTEDKDKDGGATVGNMSSIIDSWQDGDLYITNSLPYALPVEYGHSHMQAPRGMVRITVAEWNENVARQARAVE